MGSNGRADLADPESGGASKLAKSAKEKKPRANEDLADEEVVVAPDGGYGWIILIASFFVNVIVDGIIFTFGVLKEPLQDAFGSSASAVAWVGSFMSGFYLLAGPVVSGLCNRYGARQITIIGSFVAATAIAISFSSQSLGMMLTFYGFFAGVGFGMTYLPAIVIVGEYFEKKRALATGLAVSGSGIGGFIFPELLRYLIHEYGWRSTVLLIGGIALNCAVFGSLFRPLKPVRRNRRQEEADAQVTRSESFLRRIQDARDARIDRLNADSHIEMSGLDEFGGVSPQRMEVIEETNLEKQRHDSVGSRKSGHSNSAAHPLALKPDALYAGSVQNLPEVKARGSVREFRRATSQHGVDGSKGGSGCCPASVSGVLRQMLNLSLLKSPTFLLTCITSFMTLAGFFIPFFYIMDLVKERGLDDEESRTRVLQAISITNTLGRIIVGWLADYPKVDPVVVACSALILGGVATIFAPFYSGFVSFIGYALVFGLAMSAFAALRSIILVDLFGIAMLNNSFGLQMLFQGVACLVGSPIAGAIADATGSYEACFYFAGTLIGLSGAMLFPVKIVQRWEKRRAGGQPSL